MGNKKNNNNTAQSYDTFEHVRNPELRTWNRVAMLFSITSELGRKAARDYYEQFNDLDMARIDKMIKAFRQEGYSAVRQRVMKEAFNG